MGKPNLCLCLTGKTLHQNLQILERYQSSVELAELRADFLNPTEWQHVHRFPEKTDRPIILTMRRKTDGGFFADNDAARADLILRALEGSYGFLDLEIDFRHAEIQEKAKKKGIRVIRSLHELRGPGAVTGRELKQLTSRVGPRQTGPRQAGPDSGGEIPKLAVLLQSSADLVALLRLGMKFRADLENRDRILIGMGEYGISTRILAAKLGAFLCYASSLQTAAPGQLDVDSLLRIYRFHRIGNDTAVYGIVAKPVMHSFSPRIHNTAFDHWGMDAVYLPLLTDQADDFFELAEHLDIRGASVSIPHKQSVIPFLDSMEDSVTATGACNTLVRNSHGRNAGSGGRRGWHGANTDVAGFLSPLAPYLGAVRHKRATVIGAGGSARSVVFALRREGFQVLILNRTVRKAQDLAEQHGCEWGALDSSGAEKALARQDLIVQTTSAGMLPKTEVDPLPSYRFKGREIVYDIIYNPPVTRFLQRARDAGCKTIMGKEMLLGQADAQFRLFTGKDLPHLDYDLGIQEG